MPSCEAAIKDFLKDVSEEEYPSVCVIGIAGAVINNSVNPVNIPGWKEPQVGEKIRVNCKFSKFVFINDFVAMGYGVSTLK